LYRLEKVSQVFGDRVVLDIESLQLEKRGILGLLGPNGSGKTTLLKILAFLERPTQGRIFFQGQEVAPREMAAFRSKAVWSPQYPIMFSGSLLYNVEFPLKIKGIPAATRRKRALELLELVGLTELVKAPAPKLSGGESQRASLARALAAGAEVLLLDEPTASVDAAARGSLTELIASLAREGLSIILATHDQALEERLVQRKIRLLDGKIVQAENSLTLVGELTVAADCLTLLLPPEAPRLNGRLKILSLTRQTESALVEALDESQVKVTVRLSGGASLERAWSLTLGDTLEARVLAAKAPEA
jgi:ABC-type multidrug transport system ATPase subunit